MAGENVSRIETVFLSKDGTLVTVEGSVFCKYEEGRPVSIACILRDITERKRAEDALKLFRTLIDRSNDAIEVLDPETGRFLDINEKACLDLGYSREEFLALSVFDIDPTLDPPFFTRAREELRKSGTLLWEGVHRRKDGSTFPVEVNIKYVQLDRDYIVTVVRDITERKRAEEKNRLLAHTIESISEIASITDLEDRFTFVNKAFLETYGYALEEVVGQHVGILRSPNIPSGLYDEIPDQSRKGGWKGEILNMTKDGREFPLSLRTSPIKDEKGTLIGLVGIAEDITERKRAEKALRQSEEQYRIFFEDDLTGDYISTPDGKILACNPAFVRIFGFASVEEALKINASTLYAVPEKRERFLTLLREKKRLEYVETEHIRSDGTKLYGVENAIGIFDAQGNLTQIRGYLFDDTKRKLLEQQLFQAQKLESLGTLAGGIAHDFNNILGIIMGHASLLERLSAEPHVISRNTEAITKAAMRGAALVRQLLTFARKTDVLIETVLLNDMVNEVSELLAETFPKTITISLHIDKDLPPIVADATQLHQVLLNLCVNARDAMPNGGTLTITTQRQPGEMIRARFPKATEREYIKLSVADTGVGMDEATRTRIFEPFFTTKERGKGTGLGLSLVFGIVESHNGFIAVDSAPGKGTMFELFFPVLEKPAELKQAKEEPTEDIPGGNETILFVEDEKMLRDLVNAFLVAKGYTVLTAADGNEAVVLYQQHKEEIQLVILDMNLPKFNGYEVFHRLKTANRTVKVILASGYLEFDMKSKMLKAGVKDFIQKPYSPHEMLRRIRSLLDNA
jgi:PAS domain S-box-containing protein